VRFREIGSNSPLLMFGQNIPGGHVHHGVVGSTMADAASEICADAGPAKHPTCTCASELGGSLRAFIRLTLHTRGTTFPILRARPARGAFACGAQEE